MARPLSLSLSLPLSLSLYKRYRMYNGTFSGLKCAGLFYEFLKKAGLPQGTQVQLRIYDINSQKWKWLGDWKDL